MNLKKLIYFFSSLLVIAFPVANFKYKIFRGVSCHFLHQFEKTVSFPFSVPDLFQKYIHFYLTDFAIVAIFIGLCFLKETRMHELFFNRHSRYLTFYSLAAFFSILFSLFSSYFLQYTALINLILALLAFHLVFVIYQKRLDLISRILWGLLIVSSLECVIGVGQFVMQHHLGLQFLSEPAVNPYMHNIAVFDLSEGKQFLSGWFPWIPEGHTRILRSHGTFDHPNIFAGYLAITLFVSYYAYITSTKRRGGFLILLLIALQILTLVLTFARGGFFGWIFGTIIFFSIGLTKKTTFSPAMKKKIFMLGAFLLTVVTGILIFLSTYLIDRGGIINYNGLSMASDQGRLFYYRIAFLLILYSPFIGIGFNGFSLFPYGILNPELKELSQAGGLSHNIYLQIAAETGIIGLTCLFLFIVSLFKPYIKKRFSPLSLTLGIIFITMLFIGLADHYWIAYTSGRLMFFLFGGLFAACTAAEISHACETNATVPLSSCH